MFEGNKVEINYLYFNRSYNNLTKDEPTNINKSYNYTNESNINKYAKVRRTNNKYKQFDYRKER